MWEKRIFDMKRPYIKTFFSAFFIFLLSLIPILLLSGGVYLSIGDYNEQSIVFTEHINNLLHSKDGLPSYDWQSDLGMNTITSYGGFMFSPFAWILLLLPAKAVPYAHTFVVALKIGVSALAAFIYCRQYVKKDSSAYICGMLYAFSGFQLFNLVYQFADTICLFPLVLYAFDKLVTERRPVMFALMLAVNGFINYYFLWEECVFILIYFIVRVVTKSYPKIDIKLFLRLAFETLAGVMISAVLLLPSALSLSGNARAGSLIFDSNLLAYEDHGVILRAVQSMFLPPEFCSIGWYFTDKQLCLSPPVLYLPFFTIIGVWAVLKRDKRSWYGVFLAVCAVTACIPLLNSVYSMFNVNYYARWFFMPILIMVMITGKYVDDIESYDVKIPMRVNCILLAVLGVLGVYTVFVQFKVPEMDRNMWIMFLITAAAGLGMVYLLFHPKENLKFISIKNLNVIVCIFCFLPFFERNLAIAQKDNFEYMSYTVDRIWNDFQPVDLQDNEFFRISTGSTFNENSGLIWGYPSIDMFNSLVTGEETSFYSVVGLERLQSGDLNEKDYAINSFLSVKYDFYYNEPLLGGIAVNPDDVYYNKEGFNDYDVYGNYLVYKNSAFVPMGYTFDYYLNTADFKPYSKENKDSIDAQKNEKLLLKAIWLDDDLIEKYSDILTELPYKLKKDTSDETYYKDCKARADSACYEFNTVNDGFNAKIDLEKDNLVFFSVPYDKGFTAYVDGQETEIERVFDGLSAVYVPKGDHSIEFKYTVPGLKTGIIVSVGSAASLFLYGAICFVLKRKGRTKKLFGGI